ncbi:hypothetical protein SDRG_16433 [Saprolegnia diclina VS20]|uniref:Uncharacterized protein n=1 Tax=Saprolegnia diclina (strain VS20) TaxID=1156394 RepID=T0PXD5_SAPDV|nr:hypothetical protein SDRG_16433 [Saprolegnia diclina VS20]EQC25695.1 hypothetical protein SDRG_16433 [Saprolegnia diclina VS20]|eukprot:XP_008620865.1 hypothetical protein SDRG_16433 [Saprolegnia diclina VS20]
MDTAVDGVLATEPGAAPMALEFNLPPSDKPMRVSRPSRLNTQILGQLQTRKYILTLGFFISCVWNLVAPLKAWALSRYGFVSTADTIVLNVNWNTVLNGRFLTQLYTSSGIALRAPRPADRYINVFLDFIVVPRSELTWAKSLYGTGNIFQMDLDGRCMRQSLDGPRQADQFNKDILAYTASGYPLWGTEVVRAMVPPVPGFVQLHEISEAMLCLKGMPLEDYVNVQFVSSLQPYNKSSDAAAIAMWRQKLFPNLSECLARRAALVAAANPPADGVAALAKELAATFKTGVVNIAGNAQLYTPMTFLDGFVDLSGLKSGSVTYQLNGRDPSALLFAGSGYLDAVMNPRETAWWCSIQYVDPATNSPNATQCFEKVATTLPSVFLGKYVVAGAGSRFSDYPSFVMDMLTQGTQASIVMTKANGSEAIILNFIALLSLAGYGYFFVRISIYLYQTAKWIRRMPDSSQKKQLLYSVVNCSISSVIWSHYRTSMQFIGFLGFIAWHLGTSSSSCQWDHSIVDVSVDATYSCRIDSLGHFSSFAEIIRLFSYSWVFYALVFMDRMPGIAIYMPGYIVAALLLGFVPLSLLAIVVAEICKARLQSPALFLIHNQLFLVLLWLAVFWLLRTPLLRPVHRLVELCLGLVGVKKQKLHIESPFYAMLGDHFWIETALHRDEDVMYVPLSVLMETKNLKLRNIYDHEYFTYGVLKTEKTRSDHPLWLQTQLEYYVRVHE